MENPPKRITTILSYIDKAVEWEWIVEGLDPKKFELSFIFLDPAPGCLERYLRERGIPVIRVPCAGRSDLPLAFLRTYLAVRKLSPEIVHAHLFEGSIIGLAAAILAGVKDRVHTRHHGTSHHESYPHIVKYDRLINAMATRIVAISRNVWDILEGLDGAPREKLRLIPHGFKLQDFAEVPHDRVLRLKKKYRCEGRGPIVGVISRFVSWKGVQHVIPAFKRLLAERPDAKLVMANAVGAYTGEIRGLLAELPEGSYQEIEFETDLFALYRLFDVFVHVPTDPRCEAFGQTYVESLAAGIPSVFTLSGIANEFVRDGENALVVPYRDSEAIYSAIRSLLDDGALARRLVQGGKDSVARFSHDNMLRDMEKLYASS